MIHGHNNVEKTNRLFLLKCIMHIYVCMCVHIYAKFLNFEPGVTGI